MLWASEQFAGKNSRNGPVRTPRIRGWTANLPNAFEDYISAKSPLDLLQHVAGRFDGRETMVQPFMPRILDEGEFSLFYFNGEYSHGVLKVPAKGEFRSQEERGGVIRRIRPLGERVPAALEETPLYARVDFVRGDAGEFLLMELELVEPSLYLRTDPQAPFRFAAAINDWMSG